MPPASALALAAPRAVDDLLGGQPVLACIPRTPPDWVTVIRQGIIILAVDALTRLMRLSQAELAVAGGFPSAPWPVANGKADSTARNPPGCCAWRGLLLVARKSSRTWK